MTVRIQSFKKVVESILGDDLNGFIRNSMKETAKIVTYFITINF